MCAWYQSETRLTNMSPGDTWDVVAAMRAATTGGLPDNTRRPSKGRGGRSSAFSHSGSSPFTECCRTPRVAVTASCSNSSAATLWFNILDYESAPDESDWQIVHTVSESLPHYESAQNGEQATEEDAEESYPWHTETETNFMAQTGYAVAGKT